VIAGSMEASLRRIVFALLTTVRFAVTAAILCCIMGKPLALAATSEAPGLVTFTAPASCVMHSAKTLPVRIRSLSYYLNDREPPIPVPTFTSSNKTITWTASMAPGVYLYDLYGWGTGVAGDGSKGFCSSGSHLVVVLPRDSIHVEIEPRFSSGTLDDIFRSPVVYGAVPADVRIRLLGFRGAPPCGARVSTQPSSAIIVQRDSVGYWSDGFFLSSVLALVVQQGSQARYIRIALMDSRPHVGVPKSIRLDVTAALMSAALIGAPDKLLCL
jgi:hypothetical protein